jgi:hypothetical protein
MEMPLLSLPMFWKNTQATDLKTRFSHLQESQMTATIQRCRLTIPKT